MSTNSYGRRTWDVDEYAKKALDEKKRHRNKDSNDNKKSQSAHEFFSARNEQINKIDSFNQISFVSSLNSKDAGFYCEVCNRKFKDNLKFIDHLNSTEHLIKSGFDDSSLQTNFNLNDVIEKLESIKEKKLKNRGSDGISSNYIDFNERIKIRKQFDEKLKEKKKLKKELKKQKKNSFKGDINDDDDEMMKAMGFSQFGSTN